MAMDSLPTAIWRLPSGARTKPGALRHGRVRLRRHSPRPDMQTNTHITHHQLLARQRAATGAVPVVLWRSTRNGTHLYPKSHFYLQLSSLRRVEALGQKRSGASMDALKRSAARLVSPSAMKAVPSASSIIPRRSRRKS